MPKFQPLRSMFRDIVDQLFTPIPVVRSSTKSVMGTMHRADNIPNQDGSFILHSPDAQSHPRRKSAKQHAGVQGIFAIGVFDGHGPKGHEASSIAAQRMKFALSRIAEDQKDISLEQTVKTAFAEITAALNSAPCGTDSGTTGSVVAVRNDDVVVANVGDSAVYCVSRSKWTRRPRVNYVSPMHRPTNPAEAERVKLSGGQIQDGYVVDQQCKMGIGVSRTIGDRDMGQYGCIPDPTFHSFKLQRRDYTFVVATDGLWDVPRLDSEAAVLSATRGLGVTPQQVCKRLQKRAKDPSDDCTVACMIVV